MRKSSRKIEVGRGGVKVRGLQRAPPQFEEAAEQRALLTVDRLFPTEQGATGINSSALTASLTGRILFFLLPLIETTLLTQPGVSVRHPPLRLFLAPSRGLCDDLWRGAPTSGTSPGAGSARWCDNTWTAGCFGPGGSATGGGANLRARLPWPEALLPYSQDLLKRLRLT